MKLVRPSAHFCAPTAALVLSCALTTTGYAAECLIEPTQTVEVASAVAGVVTSVSARRGDKVTKGQVLATLDDRTERAAMEVARFRAQQTGPAELATRKIYSAQLKFSRRQAMARERLIPSQDSDDAESELRLAQAELLVAQENQALAQRELEQHMIQVDLRTVLSPTDGVIVERKVHPGEAVDGGNGQRSLFKIAQIHPLQVQMILSKEYFGKIRIGDAIAIRAETPVSEQLKAKVKAVDRVVDAASGTFVAWLELPNTELRIPSGLRCQAVVAPRP